MENGLGGSRSIFLGILVTGEVKKQWQAIVDFRVGVAALVVVGGLAFAVGVLATDGVLEAVVALDGASVRLVSECE